MRLRLDPHVHSEWSFDAETPVPSLLSRAGAVGLDAIAVTDHDTVEGSLRARDLGPTYGVLSVPGVELSTADGHLLCLGVERCPEPGRTLGESIETVHEMGGAAVVPHPFQRTRHGVGRRALSRAEPDGLEVFNAICMTGARNRRAAAVARRRGLPRLGGSDAHRPRLVGRAHTEVVVEADARTATELEPATVVEAIREGRTTVAGERAPLTSYVRKVAECAERRVVGELAAVRDRL